MQVLVVGSDPAFIREKFTPMLAGYNIQVQAHWSWASTLPSELPADCQGVLLIVPEATPLLRKSAKYLADLAKVPFVCMSREFASAVGALHNSGLIINGTRHTPLDFKTTDDDVYETVLVYCCREIRETQSIPSESECRGVVERVYGMSTPLRREVYKRAVAQAQVKTSVKTPGPTLEQQVKTIQRMLLIIEDRPEKTEGEVADEVFREHNEFHLKRDDLFMLARATRAKLMEKWQRHWRLLTDEERAQIFQMKLDWATRFFTVPLDKDGNASLPSYKECHTAARRVFGTAFKDSITTEGRNRAIELMWPDPDAVEPPSPDPVSFVLPKLPTPAPNWAKHYPSTRLAERVPKVLEMVASWEPNDRTRMAEWLILMDQQSEGKPLDTLSQGLFEVFVGAPLDFALACLQVIEPPTTLTQSTVIRGYRILTGHAPNGGVVKAAAWALGRTLRDRSDLRPLPAPPVAFDVGFKPTPIRPNALRVDDEVGGNLDELFEASEREALMTETRLAKEESARLRVRNSELTAEAVRLNSELTERAVEVNNLNHQLAGVKGKLTEAGKATRAAEALMTQAQLRVQGYEDLVADCEGLRQSVVDLKTATQSLEAERNELAAQVDAVTGEVAGWKAENKGLRLDYERVMRERNELRADAEFADLTAGGGPHEVVQEPLSAPMTLREALEMGYDIKLTRSKS